MKSIGMKILLFVLGFLPFILGGFINRIMITYDTVLPPINLIGLIFLLFWGVVAHFAKPHLKSSKDVVIFLNAVAAFDLVLIGIQELVFRAYWFNVVGHWSQFFYLPLLGLGFTLTRWSSSMFISYCASFALMVIVSALGCKLRKN